MKDVFVCLYGIWINGQHYDYDRWYGTESSRRRFRKAEIADGFYVETWRSI